MIFDPNKAQETTAVSSMGELKVHYHLQGGVHSMDASSRNRAEGELLALLREVSSALDVSFQVETRAYGEGGLVEYLDLVFQQKDQITFVMALLSALLGAPFYIEKVRQSKQQTLLNELNLKKLKLELQDMEASAEERAGTRANQAKSERLALEPPVTPEDIAQALLTRKKVLRRRSNYYDALLKDTKVEAVGYATDHSQDAAEQVVRRGDFNSFVVSRAGLAPLSQARVRMEIVSPVLRAGSIKWRGIFDKKVISFDLADEAFLDRVSSKRVQFQNGTSLICDLDVLQREDETGEVDVTGYVVTKVHEVLSPAVEPEKQSVEQLSLLLHDQHDGPGLQNLRPS